MADARFFQCAGPFSLAEIAAQVGARLGDPSTGTLVITDLATLDDAAPTHLSLFAEPRHRAAYHATSAGAVLTTRALAEPPPAGAAALMFSDNPRLDYVAVARLFYPEVAPAGAVTGDHPRAPIAADAVLGADCRIAPGAAIGAKATLGSRCRIGVNAVIGPGVVVGADCVVGDGASISHALIGHTVTIYPGVRIGTPGFGFVPGPGGLVRVPQLGRVVIGDRVEIGANSTVDRGSLGDTVIGAGTVIDNLVQIAHNVRIGAGCVIAAQVGIAGSATLGDGVMVGGQAAIADHVALGSGARIAGNSGVMRDVPAGATVGGSPAVPIRQWHRQTTALAQLVRRRPSGDPPDER